MTSEARAAFEKWKLSIPKGHGYSAFDAFQAGKASAQGWRDSEGLREILAETLFTIDADDWYQDQLNGDYPKQACLLKWQDQDDMFRYEYYKKADRVLEAIQAPQPSRQGDGE